MIRTALRHHAPERTEEACALLTEHGPDAAVLGGGTVLVPWLGRGERSYGHVVDLRRLDLHGVVPDGDDVAVGAMATYTTLLAARELDGRAALLRLAASGITGGAQLRNQATVGGSACYANPSSDVPGVLVATQAQLELQSPQGVRRVTAADFFRDAMTTALTPGEVLTTIRLPRTPARVGYTKLKLSEGSWPIATAAACVEPGGRGTVTLGAVCRTPVNVDVTELLDEAGRLWPDADLDALIDAQLHDLWEDELAPAEYRRQVAGVVARRALKQIEDRSTQ